MWSGSILFEIETIFSTMVTSMTFFSKGIMGEEQYSE